MKTVLISTILFFSIFFSSYSDSSIDYNGDLKYSQVQFVKLTGKSNGTWTFDVTILHEDTGWDHYADLWVIVDPETDSVLGTRVLAHPHVNEQPFTRSLSSVNIPEDINIIEIRSKCNLHGFLGKSVRINFDVRENENYIID